MSEQKLDRILKGLEALYKQTLPAKYRTPSLDFYMPKTGQLQFSCGGPTWREPTLNNGVLDYVCERPGAVFVDGAPPDPNNPGRLDWANQKIVFAMSDKDIGEVLYAMNHGKDVRLIHAPNENDKTKTKTFSIQKGEGGTFKIALSDSVTPRNGSVKTPVNVSAYIKGGDMMRLVKYLETVLPFIMGCHKVG